MGGVRQVALDLQQDIATSDDTSCVTQRLTERPTKEIEQICSLEIDGRTVFQTIASYDRANILEKILSFGVNINRVDRYAVHVAIAQKAVNVMKILLAHKANIDRATDDGKTPLHIASELGYVKIVRELLENGAKSMINQPEKTGCTPLTLACMTDHRETATCLMIYGAAINFERAFPPLHAAALMGYTDLVRMLLDRGAYVNLVDVKGETALHYASYKSHKQIVQLLLQKGAIVSCPDARRKTPVDLATDEEIKRLLENKLKTERDMNHEHRKKTSPKRLALDTIPAPADASQAKVEEAILEEDEQEGEDDSVANKRLENGISNDSTKSISDKSRSSSNKSNSSERGRGKMKRLNLNHNNSSEGGAAAFPEKKMSQQSTYSADSETGERKTVDLPLNTHNLVTHPRDHEVADEPSTSKDMRNDTISEEHQIRHNESNSNVTEGENSTDDEEDDDDIENDSTESEHKKVKKKKKGCIIL